MKKPWLSLVGIGEDGMAGLTAEARSLLDGASVIIGGKRHLSMIKGGKAETMIWPSPIETILPVLEARRGEPIVILASGDPFFYGVATMLVRAFGADAIISHPQPSAFSLACNQLGWSGQDCLTISLHGRPLETIVPLLQPHAKVLVLAWDGATAGKLSALLDARGFGQSRIHVLEAMGGPRERIRTATAHDFALNDIADLNTLAIEMIGDLSAKPIPLTAGLDDDAFDHDGQITKRDIRAITLGALAPLHGETLWDIGAGTGSIGIEWMQRHPSLKAVAIEADSGKCQRIHGNALSLGVPGLTIIEGKAPSSLPLGTPDAIFIGGGLGTAGLVDAAMAALRAGGRLVANGVTLEAESRLLSLSKQHGGRLTRLCHSEMNALGDFHAMRPALPITQWRWVKP